MTDSFHAGRTRITTVAGVHRRATLGSLGVTVDREVMALSAESREAVDRAPAPHRDKCPTAATLQGAVAVTWTADIEEA